MQRTRFVKPARPSVKFPSYVSESSVTAVDTHPCFDVEDDETEIETHVQVPALPLVQKIERIVPRPAPPRPSAGAAAASPSPAPAHTLPKTSPRLAMPSTMNASAAAASRTPSAKATTRAVDVPPPPADLASFMTTAPRPAPAPAPTWALPAVPKVTAIVPERKELPSFGPVAFDLDADLATKLEPDTKTGRTHVLVSVAAAAATICLMIGQYVWMSRDDRTSVSPASANDAPMALAEVATATEAPALPPLSPAELFPPAPVAVKVPKSATPAPPGYRIERARLAADIARRNVPAVYVPLATTAEPARFGAPTQPPNVDELLRSPRLRGERD